MMYFCVSPNRTGRPAAPQREPPTPCPSWPPPVARPGRWGVRWAQKVPSSPTRAPSAPQRGCSSSGATTWRPAQPSAHTRWPSRCPRCSFPDTCSLVWVTIIITPIITTTMSCLSPLRLNHLLLTPLNSPPSKCCPHSRRPPAPITLSTTVWHKTSPASSRTPRPGITCPEAIWTKGSNGGAYLKPTPPPPTITSLWADSWFWATSHR